MKKIVFPFVEIEVPDDCPSGLDPEAAFEYLGKHPEVVNHIVREYRKAYRKWIKSQGKNNAATSEPKQTKTRSWEILASTLIPMSCRDI